MAGLQVFAAEKSNGLTWVCKVQHSESFSHAMRFRLRTLLAIVTLAGILCGWAAYLRHLAAAHREQAAKIGSRIAQASSLYQTEVVAPMFRYKLRTLLILLAVLPPFLAWWGWPAMKRILWPPKPTIQLNVNILTFDFAFPISVPPEANQTAADDGPFAPK
jgi:hypothetical protein